MRKKIFDEVVTKGKKREVKNRPRMKLHGAGLRSGASGKGNGGKLVKG